ncbi:MFS transporter [Burkholderia anthina]|uniref:MFS transporter n=1 Tax=Burkholderia anthina TaxID=179879 RepID=UPI001CF495E6|nr:MFS transporter [Burkholderia anthina]MCA8094859.1 MFS transporter [Burkholderia anthina]
MSQTPGSNPPSPMATLAPDVASAGTARRTRIRQELTASMPVLIAVTVGSALGIGSLPAFTLPFFIGPLHDAFGWATGEVGMAYSVLTAMIFLCGPMAGRLADRVGARRVIVVSIMLFALSMLVTAQMRGGIGWFYGGYFLLGLGGAGTTYVCYAKVLSTRFDTARGLALGVMMTGPGMMATFVPLFLPPFIEAHGWRAAWIALSALTLLPLPLLFAFVRDARATRGAPGRVPRAGAQADPAQGVTLAQAARMRQFWLMIAATFLIMFALVGAQINVISVLVDTGVPKAQAAHMASVLGITMLVGRIVCGSLLDLLFAPVVGCTITLISALGLLLAAQGGVPGWVLVVALGISLGTETDFMAYVASRYFGLRSFSEVFGWIFGFMALGAATSPLWTGMLQRSLGNFRSGIYLSAGLLVVAAACIAVLGGYPTSFGGEARGAARQDPQAH